LPTPPRCTAPFPPQVEAILKNAQLSKRLAASRTASPGPSRFASVTGVAPKQRSPTPSEAGLATVDPADVQLGVGGTPMRLGGGAASSAAADGSRTGTPSRLCTTSDAQPKGSPLRPPQP
jgi:hypothetical protein